MWDSLMVLKTKAAASLSSRLMVTSSPSAFWATVSMWSSGEEAYLEMKSISRATPTFVSLEVKNTGMNVRDWNAL